MAWRLPSPCGPDRYPIRGGHRLRHHGSPRILRLHTFRGRRPPISGRCLGTVTSTVPESAATGNQAFATRVAGKCIDTAGDPATALAAGDRERVDRPASLRTGFEYRSWLTRRPGRIDLTLVAHDGGNVKGVRNRSGGHGRSAADNGGVDPIATLVVTGTGAGPAREQWPNIRSCFAPIVIALPDRNVVVTE